MSKEKMLTYKQELADKYQLFIGGKWVASTGNDWITAYSPANGEKLAEFVDATNEDVDHAVEAAQKALETWRNVDTITRQKYLLKIADALEAQAEKIAYIESMDNGKPIRETLSADVPLSVDHFRYFASLIRSEEGTAKYLDEHTLTLVVKEPIGVVGQIVPWNFPLLMAAWKIAPALAAGCTIVIHPSSSTSLSLLELAKIFEAILPAGVVNIVTGKGSKSGNYLLHHEGLAKLAFTGSTEVGYKVAEAAAKRLIPATLELGGKSANIIFDDVNFERGIERATQGILFNQGQVCSAGSRLFVQAGIYDRFVQALKEQFEKVKVGLPWDEKAQMSAQINEGQMQKILQYIKIGQTDGVKVVTGGKKLDTPELKDGFFVAPTILADADNEYRVAQEEIFGPVVTIIKFKDEAEAIKLANETDYGLGGAVFTQDINRAFRVARAVQTGRMWVNTYNELPAGAPFGGYKKSGYGRETYKTILEAYSQDKNIFLNLKETPDGLYQSF